MEVRERGREKEEWRREGRREAGMNGGRGNREALKCKYTKL